jgi:hypothetical protein
MAVSMGRCLSILTPLRCPVRAPWRTAVVLVCTMLAIGAAAALVAWPPAEVPVAP